MNHCLGRGTVLIAILLFGFLVSGLATDFGKADDVKQVRQVVAAKVGKVLHASVSHDWALCTAYKDESDLSVILHRVGESWNVVETDGGAYDPGTLKEKGVPSQDIAPLLKAYH